MLTTQKTVTKLGTVDFHESQEGFVHFIVGDRLLVHDDGIVIPFGKFLKEGQKIEVDFDSTGSPVAIRAA